MSKSILVIDTPESCWGCGLENGHYCVCVMEYIKEDEFETVPDWCPLRDLPEKKEENRHHNNYEKGCVDGRNACIDEILRVCHNCKEFDD